MKIKDDRKRTMAEEYQGIQLMEIPLEELKVVEWHETQDPDDSSPSQVHLCIPISDFSLVIRFKGPETITELVESLTEHRDNVWGDTDEM